MIVVIIHITREKPKWIKKIHERMLLSKATWTNGTIKEKYEIGLMEGFNNARQSYTGDNFRHHTLERMSNNPI